MNVWGFQKKKRERSDYSLYKHTYFYIKYVTQYLLKEFYNFKGQS